MMVLRNINELLCYTPKYSHAIGFLVQLMVKSFVRSQSPAFTNVLYIFMLLFLQDQ